MSAKDETIDKLRRELAIERDLTERLLHGNRRLQREISTLRYQLNAKNQMAAK